MKHKIISSIALTFALSTAGFGQIIVTNQATTGVASALQADGAALLSYAEVSEPTFISAGLEFSLIPNYAIGDLVVGNGVDGGFFANVTFLARESLRPNHFGVSDAALGGYLAGGITLFADYTSADFPITKNLTAATYTDVNFWHYADKPSFQGTYFHDEILSFLTWEAIDTDANRIYTIFGIDDLRSEYIDFDDGLFLVERNLDPVDFDSPVPEPSSFALIGGIFVLALAMVRRMKSTPSTSAE